MKITNVNEFRDCIKNEARVLPDQAPLEFFVHHNNLHHFENIQFEKAVEWVFYNYGKTPYMPLLFYRQKLKNKEIDKRLFSEYLEKSGFRFKNDSLFDFIISKLHSFKDHKELEFLKKEGLCFAKDCDSIFKMNSKQTLLWEKIKSLEIDFDIAKFPDYHVNKSLRSVDKVLIPFLTIMLDQGQAKKQLDDSYLADPCQAFLDYIKKGAFSFNKSYESLLKRPKDESKEQFIAFCYEFIAKDSPDLNDFIRSSFQSLPGFAGMIYKVSHNNEVTPRRKCKLTIYHYLLFRKILMKNSGKITKTKFFQVSTMLQIKKNVFHYLSYYQNQDLNNVAEEEIKYLIKLFYNLNPIILRRIFQQSYEKTYQNKILNSLIKIKSDKPNEPILKEGLEGDKKYQLFFCIDDREESLRRHLEECSNLVETYGVAGFFGLNMNYLRFGEIHARRQCPPASDPQHLIQEEAAVVTTKRSHSNLIKLIINSFKELYKIFETNFHLFFPRQKSKITKSFESKSPQHTKYLKNENESKDSLGFTIVEAASKIVGLLQSSGIQELSQYVLLIGHGHNSVNNPHVSAYRCGACAGANADVNARLFAKMANNQEIRHYINNNFDLKIPTKTLFIGGFHDTCSDDITLFTDDTPQLNKIDEKEIITILKDSSERNAYERCRKFYQVKRIKDFRSAKKLVESRAWHLAEPRPELNHATNALCFVGRRELTKNVFLDRRAFLVSYDPEKDSNASILQSILSAVIPVCAGINLEYYFSKVDTENYGSGSKTSHNVTSLLGVMNGSRGDLRTGLVWQMVEYHEPIRILFVIETTTEIIEKIMSKNEEISRYIKNSWISLAVIDPQNSQKVKVYENRQFTDFKAQDLNILKYKDSTNVPSTLLNPVAISYLERT